MKKNLTKQVIEESEYLVGVLKDWHHRIPSGFGEVQYKKLVLSAIPLLLKYARSILIGIFVLIGMVVAMWVL